MTKLIVTFCNFMNVPKKLQSELWLAVSVLPSLSVYISENFT